jgi:GWxTD domain-containing protein
MKLLLFVLLLASAVLGQVPPKFIFTEHIIIPSDSSSTVYFTFRMPFQNIVFEKEDDIYNADLRLYIEVTDANENFIKREIKDWNYSVKSFDETNSPDIFSEGFLSFNLYDGNYYVLPIVTDKNTHRELKLERIKLSLSAIKKEYLSPIIVSSKKNNCEGKEFFKLTNFGGSIPFDKNDYNIIIPVTDISLNEIDVTVISVTDTIFSGKITERYFDDIEFAECSGKIFLTSGYSNRKTNNFILNGISTKLKEGTFTILVNNSAEKFTSEVRWYNKPFSLRKADFAIKALKHIEEEHIIDSLLKSDKEKQYQALVNFWKTKDPTPETEYNELMAEYYTRIDYTERNFSSLNGKGGWDSDRGKIYVKFGKPTKVERGSNEKGKVVEIWIYETANRRFVFVDKNGVGEFTLESNL